MAKETKEQPKQIAAATITKMNKLHNKIHARLRLSLVDAQELGRMLLEVKEQVGHGHFGKWIEKNMEFTSRTATTYMRIYESRAMLDGTHTLSLTEAYRLLPAATNKKASLKSETVSDLKSKNGPGDTKNADSAKPAEPEEDPDKRVIPEHLLAIFDTREQFKVFAQVLSTLKGQVKQAIDANPVAWAQFDENTFRAAVAQAHDCLTLGGPFIVCSYCAGLDSDKCNACKGTGYLSKARARCVPKEMRGEAL